MRKVVFLSVLVLLVSVPVFAGSSNYIALKAGGYFPQSSDMDEWDNGFNGELAFGYYFNQSVALELSVGYLQSEADVSGVSGEITSVPILLSIKGLVPITGGELYFIAGGGVYITDVEVSGMGLTMSSDDTPLGFHVGVGGNFNITENAFLGLEGKYFWAKPSFDFLGVLTEDVKIDGIQVTANVGFRF